MSLYTAEFAVKDAPNAHAAAARVLLAHTELTYVSGYHHDDVVMLITNAIAVKLSLGQEVELLFEGHREGAPGTCDYLKNPQLVKLIAWVYRTAEEVLRLKDDLSHKLSRTNNTIALRVTQDYVTFGGNLVWTAPAS